MTARKKVDYEHKQLVKRLDSDNAELKAECGRLKNIEIQHARLDEKRKGDRWKDAGTTVLMGVGGAIIGGAIIGQSSRPDVWQGIGWALLVLPGFFQLCRSGFNTA